MPKRPEYALVWIPESASYELWAKGHREHFAQADDEVAWREWLEAHVTFSFRGQKGLLNVRKESRQRGGGYWYGYRGQGKRTMKRYLGSTGEITVAKLEEVAGAMEQIRDHTNIQPTATDDSITLVEPKAEPEEVSLLQPSSLKFRPPHLREYLVERPRLIRLLEDGTVAPLTLLSAPAGFGKTTLVGQWLAAVQKEGTAAAWVALDERDNDVVGFWRGVVKACQGMLGKRSQKVLGQLTALGRLPALLETDAVEQVLTTFLNELASLSEQGIIVLEDYHFITLPQIHSSLSLWLEHLPANLRVVMLTRHDPPLPLARWRVRGILRELRGDALRFTTDETALFFRRYSVHVVSHEEMMRLLERTEGWIAGLQLAALVLNGKGREESTSSVLQGDHHYVTDYLVQEVLKHLPEHVQLFLEQTAVLERLHGRLCEAVTGQPGGQEMLEWLEGANLFLVPLDEKRQWYRYHQLFREVLLQRLAQQKRSEGIAELQRRAGHWFLRERMPVEAVAHAYAAQDFALLADVIEQSQSALLQQGENATLAAWIGLLPQAVLLERLSIFFLACMENIASHHIQAAIALFNTYAHAYHLPEVGTGDSDALERALCEHVGQRIAIRQQQQNAIFGFLGFYATLTLIIKSDVGLYQQIRQRSERYAPADRLRKQEGWLADLLRGDVEGAIADLMKNLTESTRRQGDTILFAYLYPTLTYLLTVTGQLHLVEATAQRMLQREDTLDARLNHGPALIDLGSVAYERDHLKQAEDFALEGLSLCHYPGCETARYRGLLLLAKIKRAQGDKDAAWGFLQNIETELAKSNQEAGALKSWSGLIAWVALELGDAGYAQRWLRENPITQDRAGRLNPLSAYIYLTQAFFLLRFERRGEAEALLSDLTRWAKQLRLKGLIIHLLALQSILTQAEGKRTQAETLLREALVLAEVDGHARTFLDLGEGMQELLVCLWNQRQREKHHPSVQYLGRLLSLARAKENKGTVIKVGISQELIEPLSQREQEVLREITEGYSNQEIARHLVISASTVKSHVNSIYRKLQTKNRAQTIARARTLQLLPH